MKLWIKWTRKCKNPTSTSDNFVFRSSGNKTSKACPWNKQKQWQRNQRQKYFTQPATPSSETMWVKMSKAWTWDPWKNPLVLFRCHHSNTDCMNGSFKVHFIIFIEEIEPCQFEIQNFSVANSVKFKNYIY